MKTLAFLAMAAGLSFAQISGQKVELPKPNLDRGHSITKSLSLRKSASGADFQNMKDLTLSEISDLLYAANGVNRADGHRTAPSANNAQDIDVYVLTKNGAYIYDAKKHALNLAASGDLRNSAAGGQTAFAKAPIILLLVSDISKFPSGDDAGKRKVGALDAGIVSQNISLFCSGTGLSTRVRVSMDDAALIDALKLKPTQIPLLNHPIGK